MIDRDLLSAALLTDTVEIRKAATAAEAALRALRQFRPPCRSLYPREAQRIARRAAVAVVELIEVARRHDPHK
jgi:hypothetical protein